MFFSIYGHVMSLDCYVWSLDFVIYTYCGCFYVTTK